MSTANFSYSTLSDDVLAELFIGGDDGAFNELALRYLAKIGSIARKYSARGYEHNDFVQEGLLGLWNAAKSYSKDKGMSFRNYASTVVERRFISIIRKQNSKKAIPDSALVTLEGVDQNLIPAESSPEDLVIPDVRLALIKERIREVLSRLEYDVLLSYADGMTYADIASLLGISVKAVDNALSRARRKLGSFDMS